jgi:copper homeostasis protein
VEAVLAATAIPVNVLIRPRDGDFSYDRYEVRTMLRDIELAAERGVHGVVIGALTADGDVDVDVCRQLTAAAGGLPVTFHRAFDLARDPFGALEAVVDLGADRLLTSGQDATALDGAPLLAGLVQAAAGRVTVMAGGGITEHNVARVARLTGVPEIHFSARTTVDSPARHRNPRVALGANGHAHAHARRSTSRAAIESIMAAAHVV